MHGHERAKAERRIKILAAARTMIGETGDTSLSMRGLAERAGLSVVTPYNLFGSKQAILEAVLSTDLENFIEKVVEAPVDNSLDRIFLAVALAKRFYQIEPAFYKTLFQALSRSGSTDLARLFNPPRQAFWTELASKAIEEGALRQEFDAQLLAQSLVHTFGALLIKWVQGNCDITEFGHAVEFEFSLTLSGAAEPAYATRLQQRALDVQARLRPSADLAAGPNPRQEQQTEAE